MRVSYFSVYRVYVLVFFNKKFRNWEQYNGGTFALESIIIWKFNSNSLPNIGIFTILQLEVSHLYTARKFPII